MKKTCLVLFLLLLITVGALTTAGAETRTGACGDSLTWTLDDSGTLTISGTGAMNNYGFVYMNENLYATAPWGTEFNQAVIESGVTSIGNYAFCNCDSLTAVTLPDSVTAIGEGAFYDCDLLADIVLPNGIAAIGNSTFKYCKGLTGVTLPDSITSIGDEAFYYCLSLADIAIPDGVASIGNRAFYDCGSLKSVALPDSVADIGDEAFRKCAELTEVTLPKNLTEISAGVFDECVHLKSISLPGSVTSIGTGAFQYCRSLKKIVIPDSVASIGDYAFLYCGKLSSAVLPDGIAGIGDSVFACTGLTEINLPLSVASIGNDAFYGCRNLKNVTILNSAAEIAQSAFGDHNDALVIQCDPDSTAQRYAETMNITVNHFDPPPTEKPSISGQPADISVATGEKAVFSVEAKDAQTYQWYCRKSPTDEWKKISSKGTSSAYRLTTAARHNGYQFYCEVSNTIGSVDSDIVTLTLTDYPVVTAQPVSVSVTKGKETAFTVTASNADSYQWYYRTSPDAEWTSVKKNGTSSSYTLTVKYSLNGCQFRCQIGNSVGSIYSDIASLTVLGKPTVSEQPVNVEVKAGTEATFSVTADNAESYRWYYRTSPEAEWTAVKKNGTSAFYTRTVKSSHNGYQFRCKIKNSAGSVYSDIASLTVLGKPTVSEQPASVEVKARSEATFSVTADNAESYRWYYRTSPDAKWTAVKKNRTSPSYTLTVKSSYNGYQFRCKIKNSVGSVYSDIATLTVLGKPTVSEQPASVEVKAGSEAVFTITATDAESFQWYYRTSPDAEWIKVIRNGASSTYTLTVKERHNGYQYRCKVKNSVGSVYSDVAILTVLCKPAISAQPVNTEVSEGSEAAFTVAAADAESYQWYYRTSPDAEWTAVESNGTATTYTLTTEERHNGCQFRCQITNSAGSVYSDIATLTVLGKPVITAQPINTEVSEGSEAAFTVAAAYVESYRWYCRTSPDAEWTEAEGNGTSSTYTLTAEEHYNGCQFRCQVTNSVGSVYSDIASLTVLFKPTITVQPVSIEVTEESEAAFTVAAADAESCQWYYRTSPDAEWTEVEGNGTSSTYTLTAEERHNGFQFRCQVISKGGSVYSDIAALTVLSSLTITRQPVSVSAAEGEAAVFTLDAYDAESYQWYYRTSSSASWSPTETVGTSPTYTLIAEALNNGYQYRCLVKGGTEAIFSNIVTLTVLSKPTITEQPVSARVKAGIKAVFTVTASNAESYQWYVQKPDDTEWSAAETNGTSATYTVAATAQDNGSKYKCEVKNTFGSVESDIVTLTVE